MLFALHVELTTLFPSKPYIWHLNFGSVDARQRFNSVFRFDLVNEDCVIPLAAHLAAAIGSYSRNTEDTTVYEEFLGGLSDSQLRSYLVRYWDLSHRG